MDLSTFLNLFKSGATIITLLEDKKINLSDNVIILQADAPHTIEIPKPPNTNSIFSFYNDSLYSIKILINSTEYISLPSKKVAKLYYGNSRWYIVVEDVKEVFHDFDPNNLQSTENVFNTNTTGNSVVTVLDATHIIVAYKDSNYGKARIGTIDGHYISFSQAYTFTPSTTNNVHDITALDSTHFAIVYSGGKVIIGTMSGSTLTFGSEYTHNCLGNSIAVIALDSTNIIISDGCDIINGIISGSTITFGNKVNFTSYGSQPSLTRLDSLRFILVYSYNDYGNYVYKGRGYLGSLNGSNVQLDKAFEFDSWTTSMKPRAVTALDANNFVVAYYTSNHNTVSCCFNKGHISGSTITFSGVIGTLSNPGLTYPGVLHSIAITTIDSTHIIVSYSPDNNNNIGIVVVGDLTSGSLSWNTEHTFNNYPTMAMVIEKINSEKFVTSYVDEGNSNYGTCALIY